MAITQNFIGDIDNFNTFNNQRLLSEEMPSVVGIPHIFFTTPMLNLDANNCLADGFLSGMYRLHEKWLGSLSYSGSSTSPTAISTTSPFIKILYNSAMDFQSKDMISKTKEVGETYYGYKETLPSADVDSIVGDELTISFVDWQGLPVLNILNAWFIYHNNVRRGRFNPSINAIEYSYLDYVSSIYYFVTDMDGQTLQYWAKYTGVVPINVPFSAFSSSYNNHDVLKYSVNFVYSFKEDMNPDILLDFNDVANGRSTPINYNNYNVDGHHGIQTGYQSAKGNAGDFVTTEFQKNGATKPEIVLTSRTLDTGVITGTPKFRLLFKR